jgi:SAM-dependent methyltransferase
VARGPEGAEPERFAARRAFLLDHVAAGERVLDLGCGDGAFAAELLAPACEVTMADVADEALAARPRAGAGGRGGALAEGAPLPFAEDAFEVVGPARCSSTSPTSSACWPRCAACCAGSGRLLVTTPWHGA